MLSSNEPATLDRRRLGSARPLRPYRNVSQNLKINRTHECMPNHPGVTVRPVHHRWELDEVYRITHDAYVERGYCTPKADGRLIHYPALEKRPETTVFVALDNKKVMGTVSLSVDGACGLNVDHDFPSEMRALRGGNRALGAVWRMATRKALRGERRVVMALIRAVVRQAFETQELHTFLVVVNPCHESAYQRILNMQLVARSLATEGLRNAPGALMRCDLERCPKRLFSSHGENFARGRGTNSKAMP